MLCFRVWAGVRMESPFFFNSCCGRENCKKFQTCVDFCSIFTSFHTCPVSRPRSWGKCLCWKRLPVGLITCGFNNHFLLPKWYGWGSLLLLVPKELYVCLGTLSHRPLSCELSAYMHSQLRMTSSFHFSSLPWYDSFSKYLSAYCVPGLGQSTRERYWWTGTDLGPDSMKLLGLWGR